MGWMTSEPVHNLGLTLLHFVWQGALIGLLYGVCSLLARRARAQVRYDLAVLALAILAATPIATFLYLSSQPAVTGGGSGNIETLVFALEHSVTSAQAGTLLHWVVAAWMIGVAILSTRLLLGWRHLTRLRRSADRAAAEHLRPLLDRIGQQLRIVRQVQLAVSSRINSPVVIGWIKPLILLPPAVVVGLPARQLEMVLAHELAHIRRYDHFINLFQTIVETLLFYHPVVLWVSRRIRIERENACDDLAVEVTDNRLAYVEMLATLEKLRQPAPRLVLAIHDGQILSRIRRLVEQGRPGRQYGLTLPSLVLATLLATAVGIGLMPEPSDNLDVLETAPATLAASEPEPAMSAPEPVQVPDEVQIATVADQPSPEPASSAAPASVAEPSPEEVAPPTEPEPAPTRSESDPVESLASAEPVALDTPAVDTIQPSTAADAAAPVADTPNEPGNQPAAEAAIERDPAPDRRLALATIPETINLESSADTRRAVEPEPDRITGGDLLRRIEPTYPLRARHRQANGTVEVEFLVTQSGQVSEIEVIRERPRGMGFASAASNAVAKWQFEPFRKGEEPIERKVRIEIDFGLASDEDCRDLLGSRIPRC